MVGIQDWDEGSTTDALFVERKNVELYKEENHDEYDYLVIDTAPRLGHGMMDKAIHLADIIIIPMVLDEGDITAAMDTVIEMLEIDEDIMKKVKILPIKIHPGLTEHSEKSYNELYKPAFEAVHKDLTLVDYEFRIPLIPTYPRIIKQGLMAVSFKVRQRLAMTISNVLF